MLTYRTESNQTAHVLKLVRNVRCLHKYEQSRALALLIDLLWFNTSTIVGHFVSSPREREKKDRKDSRGDEREGQGR